MIVNLWTLYGRSALFFFHINYQSLGELFSPCRLMATPPPRARAGVPEICAYGFRNPWRCGFDRQTDELRCGDVGHTDVESIYEVK